MESLVFQTITDLLEIKKRRLEERGEVLSGFLDDEIIVHIDNLVELLKENYLKQ